MGDDSEWIKLPTEEKVVHKAWKARLTGYEECIKLFGQLDEKSPEFSKYLGLAKKFVVDGNAIAQEKGLEAVSLFVENAFVAGKTVGEVSSGIIAKCLNSPRSKTKDTGIEILMLYIEAEKHEIVQDELMKGLSNKQPKIVAACVQALRMAIRDFGTKTILVKPIVKVLQGLMEDRDKTVRDETKLLMIEIYRWVGAAIKPQLANLKPVQVAELEAEFDKIPPGKPVQSRFLRSQQDLKAKIEARALETGAGDGSGDVADGVETSAPDVDPYELMDAINILAQLPKDFYEKIEAKKWQERREALDAVAKLCELPKLEAGDYGDLVRALKKVVAKDSNILLVASAAKCLCGLATGLRKKFQPYAVLTMQCILEKFKEKKPAVVTVLREASDAVFVATTLEAISEDACAALENKNPQIKAETALLLARSFRRCTTATLPKKLLKVFCALLCKTINDTAPEVREASFEALGTAMKVVGEKPLAPFLTDVDSLKLAKIQEYAGKVVLPGKETAAAVPKPAAPKAAEKAATSSRPKTAPTADSKKAAPGKRPAGAGKGKKAGGAAADSPSDEFKEDIISDDVLEDRMSVFLADEPRRQLESGNWKERLAGMEKFTEVVKMTDKAELPTQICVRTLLKKPGLKDNNFQVLKLRMELVKYLAENGKFSRCSATFVLPDLVDKVGDAKNGQAAKDALTAIAEACNVGFVCQEVINEATTQKNPKNQAECLNWMTQAITEFGFKITFKPMLSFIKLALGHTNPAVRTSAINLLPILYMYMGPQLRALFEGEKPALLKLIDDEIDKVQGQKPPPPIRGVKPKDESAAGGEDEADGDEANNLPSPADLVPRNDISDKITAALVEEMNDKNWKVRNEGLQKLAAILNEAKFITGNLGQLPEALKVRLGDSNKILVNTTLTICQTLATALGPHLRPHVKAVIPAVMLCLGDNKTSIRSSAEQVLNMWLEQVTLKDFFADEMLLEVLRKESPILRAELLKWLAEKLPDSKKLPAEDVKPCVEILLACLEDRSADVRKSSQDALVPFMVHTGYEAMARAAGKLKPVSKDQVVQLLEKARANLPQKAAPAPSAPAPAANRAKTAPAKAPERTPSPLSDEQEKPAQKAGAKAGATKANAAKTKAAPAAPPPAGKTKKKGAEEEDLSPPLVANNLKEARFKDEKSLKVLKWNFAQPRVEFVDQLRSQMESCISASLLEMLFHRDFKFHIKAVEILSKCLQDDDVEPTTANLDTILKWLTLRFFETNTSVIIKCLEYLLELFAILRDKEYHLQELEGAAFIPYLVNKVGDPKDNIRRDVRAVFKLICTVYPASKMFNYIIDGLKCKNSKQKSECLDELGRLIEVYGINVCQPAPAQALKIIAQAISERDNIVRSAALNTLVSAYNILGDAVYKYIGKLNDKDQGMLDERIKRSSKSKPPPPVVQAPAPVMSAPVEPPPNKNQAKPAMQRKQEMSNRGDTGRPGVTQYFQLEVDEGDQSVLFEPKLVSVNMDEILSAPVNVPEQTLARPASPARALILTSSGTEASSLVNLVMSQVASNGISACMQGLIQIDAVLKDEDKWPLLTGHVDQFLVSVSLQLRMAHNKHLAERDTPKEDVINLYKSILGALLSLFQCRDLAKEASTDNLKDLIYHLITVILDGRLNTEEEGPQVVRTVNVMVVKIVEKSDQSKIMSALIKLLKECVASETCSGKFLELVMKCLWRVIRLLPEVINEVNIDQILLDVHLFLKAFPKSVWKERPSDVPVRTVKTIAHTLVKLKGEKILNHLGLIDDLPASDIEQYIHKVLRSLGAMTVTAGGTAMAPSAAHVQQHNQQQQQQSSNNNANNRNTEYNINGETPRKDKSRRLSKNTHDQLAEIFKKIGSKENTREGLNDLYDFKTKFPEADLEPFLKKSSSFFQSYIERGLKNIQMEREGKKTHSHSLPDVHSVVMAGATTTIANNSKPPGPDGVINPAVYMERLKVLRARCGLDNSEGAVDKEANNNVNADVDHAPGDVSISVPTLSSQAVDTVDATSANAPPTGKAANVDEIKRRLERLKTAAKT